MPPFSLFSLLRILSCSLSWHTVMMVMAVADDADAAAELADAQQNAGEEQPAGRDVLSWTGTTVLPNPQGDKEQQHQPGKATRRSSQARFHNLKLEFELWLTVPGEVIHLKQLDINLNDDTQFSEKTVGTEKFGEKIARKIVRMTESSPGWMAVE